MDHRDKERLSILYWILNNKIVNEKGQPIEFSRHRFMLDLYTDQRPVQAILKGSQIGASTMEILRLLHAARYHGINQIYTLPTAGDVNDFVKSKVNQIILQNPCIRDGFDTKSVDSIEQKQIGRSFIFFRGTWSQSEAIMLSSDRNLHDELDKSNMDVVEVYRSRQAASDNQSLRYFSTPTVPDFGIDKIWAVSDQKHWRFTCPNPRCRHRQHMTWESIRSGKCTCAGSATQRSPIGRSLTWAPGRQSIPPARSPGTGSPR
jgi:phage terminase large subunit GpA-like protein